MPKFKVFSHLKLDIDLRFGIWNLIFLLWAILDLNQGHRPYKDRALTN